MSWTQNNEWLKVAENQDIRWGNLRRFLGHYLTFRTALMGAAAFALFGSIAAFFIPVVFRHVQTAMAARNTTALAWALAGFLLITLTEAVASYGVQRINSRVATRLNQNLVLDYYRKILNLSVEDFIAFRRRTNLFQRIIDAMSITGQFTSILVRGGQLIITVLVIGTVVATVSPLVLGVLCVGAVVLFAHALVQARKLAVLRGQSLGVNYPLVGKMTEVLGGLFTIKALAASIAVTSDVRHLVEKKTDADYNEQLAELQSNQITQVLRIVTLVSALGLSCALTLSGQLLLAEVFALYLLTNLFLQPITELAIYYQLLSRLSVTVGKFYEVLDLPDEAEAVRIAVAARHQRTLALPQGQIAQNALQHQDRPRISPSGPSLPLSPAYELQQVKTPGHIIFQDVNFAYRDGKQVLSGVNLEIRPGEKVSLIGRSGVGKTTLMRLLLGFLQPQQGSILVDGVEVTSMEDKNSFRRNFGVVSQQDFLFGTSIRENLTFGLEDGVEEERMIEALRLVNLWDDIERLPDQLDASYSDDIFSGGQKQRFFIARALLRDPSIVLLDEPTSALDFESESQVMNALDRLVGHNTTITIAHRLSTVQNADRVIVLHDGRIKSVGTHDDLYHRDDYYRSLCDYNSFVV